MGLFKDFRDSREPLKAQFRVEAFNLFNRVNLYNPIGDLGSPQFGQSTAAFPGTRISIGPEDSFLDVSVSTRIARARAVINRKCRTAKRCRWAMHRCGVFAIKFLPHL